MPKALRHLATLWLLLIAMAHVGAPVLSGLWGHPVQLSSGCDRAVAPGTSVDPELVAVAQDHGDDCDACCFCCCAHVLPEAGGVLISSGERTGELTMRAYFHHSQRVRPALLPPRA